VIRLKHLNKLGVIARFIRAIHGRRARRRLCTASLPAASLRRRRLMDYPDKPGNDTGGVFQSDHKMQ